MKPRIRPGLISLFTPVLGLALVALIAGAGPVQNRLICGQCNGKGDREIWTPTGKQVVRCSWCNGTGYVTVWGWKNDNQDAGNAPPTTYPAAPPNEPPDVNGSDDPTDYTSSYSSHNYGAQTCFIATAAYGTPWEGNVLTLRRFRETVLFKSALGRAFVALYYHWSPPVAKFIATKPAARWLTRLVLTPVVVLAGACLGNPDDIALSLLGLVVIAILVRRRHESSPASGGCLPRVDASHDWGWFESVFEPPTLPG